MNRTFAVTALVPLMLNLLAIVALVVLFAGCATATPRSRAAAELRGCLNASNGWEPTRLWCLYEAEKNCAAAGERADCARTKVSEDAFWSCMGQWESAALAPNQQDSMARIGGVCR